jgi:SAM-dependent methyltransferase
MYRKWTEYFIDPVSKDPLTVDVTEGNGERILEGRLVTGDGKTRFPVIRGVPRFVPEELHNEQLLADDDATQTGRSFGDQWRTGTKREIGRADAERESLREQFLGMLGISDEEGLKHLFKDGMNVLNAGCGVGWSEYLFNVNPRVNRFDVDLSLSVEEAYRNTADSDNVVVAQADVLSLPFRHELFDIIFSNGVLHHTRSAPDAFDSLCCYLKPGGLIGIYIYNIKPLLREMADREIRKTTTELTFEEIQEFSRGMAKLGRAFQKYSEPLLIEEDIPLLDVKRGEYNLQKFIYDHLVKCFYNERFGEDYSALVNVDWYHPKYASHHNRAEVESWFARNGVGNVKERSSCWLRIAAYGTTGLKIIGHRRSRTDRLPCGRGTSQGRYQRYHRLR